MGLEILVFLVVVALAFDFMNGFHDAANSIATIVSTGAMSPQAAVVWAAFFNFIAFMFFGLHVAATVGKGIVQPSLIDHHVIFGALTGAIAWNFITWYYGIPSSSSHALVGGLTGAAVAKAGTGSLIAGGFIKTAVAIVLSPLLGFFLAGMLMVGAAWVGRTSTPRKMDRAFNGLQFVSAALYSLGHGSNDAQKTMGIIWVLLISAGTIGAQDPLPFWVVLVCQTAMGLGTLFGGWRIVKTMGLRITKLKPMGGFCASASGAACLFLATSFGIPVSTTHTITGAIVGVGAGRRHTAGRLGLRRAV
jgi:inorganic phosphate transporter, PiT family